MESKDLEQMKAGLIEEVSRNADKKYGMDDRESEVWQNYAMSSPQGKCIYRSFSDEELLEYLRNTARELNHSPTQGEVFWVLRDYIKQRFGKWPYALRAAGLSTSAGKGGKSLEKIEEERAEKEALISLMREKALILGRIPHPVDMPESEAEFRKHFNSWNAVIKAAELNDEFFKQIIYKITDLEPEYQEMLEEVKAIAYKIGRSPLHGEIDKEVKQALIGRCGSWRNALYQINLNPVVRMQPFHDIYIDYSMDQNKECHTDSLYGCYYKVLNLTDDDRKRLGAVRGIYKKIGRVPMKKDVPKELRQALQEKCGSWGNVLFQIGISPKAYYEEKKRKKGSQKKRK